MARYFPAVVTALACVALSCAPRSFTPADPDRLAALSTIRRDHYGIPHILAQSEEAAAFAFGFAQAEDHAAEIGRRFISARGEEAKYFGDAGLTNDVAMAHFDNLAASREALGHIDPLYRRIVSAYAAGVNRYVAGHRAELPDWMPEITAADVLASTRASAANALSGGALLRRLREKYEGVPVRLRSGQARDAQDDPWIDDGVGSNALAL